MEEEKFEDCPKAIAEYESEIGVFSVKRNSHSEFFVNSLNNSDNFDVRIPTGVTANYKGYSDLSNVKKTFINIKK
jgi:predicted ATPase with chaperone activity